jgi:hypothetical protein
MNMRREAAFQTFFNKWLRENYKGSGVFELKQTQTDSISFSAVKEHQIAGLLAAKHGTLIHKLSDETRGFKPFDSFILRNTPAYVVIKYPKGFVMIDIDAFIFEKNNSIRKSLTYSRALEL